VSEFPPLTVILSKPFNDDHCLFRLLHCFRHESDLRNTDGRDEDNLLARVPKSAQTGYDIGRGARLPEGALITDIYIPLLRMNRNTVHDFFFYIKETLTKERKEKER